MNAERFATIVEAYGSDPRRWPAAERGRARTFAATPEGRLRLASAMALDEALDANAALQVNARLRTRVLDAAPRASERQLPRLSFGWAPGALAAAGLAGVVFGAALSHAWEDNGAESLLIEAAGFDETVLVADLGGDQP